MSDAPVENAAGGDALEKVPSVHAEKSEFDDMIESFAPVIEVKKHEVVIEDDEEETEEGNEEESGVPESLGGPIEVDDSSSRLDDSTTADGDTLMSTINTTTDLESESTMFVEGSVPIRIVDEEAGEGEEEDLETPLMRVDSFVATSPTHAGSSPELLTIGSDSNVWKRKKKSLKEDVKEEEEEMEEEVVPEETEAFKATKVFIPEVRDDPLHPFLEQWEKESRIWFNSDPPLDYSPTDSIDNRISDDEVHDKYVGLLGDIKCVFVDLDGTLVNIGYDAVTPTPAAVEAFNLLKEVGLKVYLVVNTWMDSKAKTVDLVKGIGFEVDELSVFTSSDCSKLLMKKHGLLHPFLLVSDDVHKDYDGMETSDIHDFDSVVVGLPCSKIDYRLLTRAIQILTDEHPLMILHPDRLEKIENGSKIMGPGVFGNVLHFATDANPLVPAKPAPGFFLEACQIAGVCPHECLMIGDNISVDVKGSKGAMCKSILVKTGVYKRNDESKYCTWIPDVVADDFASAVRILLCAQSKFPRPPEEDPETIQRLASMQREREFFSRKLAAYDSSDCSRKTKSCLPKLPSLIW